MTDELCPSCGTNNGSDETPPYRCSKCSARVRVPEGPSDTGANDV